MLKQPRSQLSQFEWSGGGEKLGEDLGAHLFQEVSCTVAPAIDYVITVPYPPRQSALGNETPRPRDYLNFGFVQKRPVKSKWY